MKPNALKVDPADNVITVLAELQAGDTAVFRGDGSGDLLESIKTRDAIPYGHKIALQPLRRGESVIKYGAPIGSVTVDIEPGSHIHIQNVRSRRMGVEA